jgi:hypothetical protein
MKKYIVLVFLVLSFTSYAQIYADGVSVYYSDNGPGAAGVYANGAMIRFLNTTNQPIQCGVTETSTGHWRSTTWLQPNHYTSMALPVGQYSWSCGY